MSSDTRFFVHGVDRRTHLFICQSEQPPNATIQPFRQMQPQRLNQHHLGELRDEKTAGAAAREAPGSSDQRVAKRHFVRFFLKMHNRRQRSQEDMNQSPLPLSEAIVPFFVVANRVAASTDAKLR